MRTLRKFSSALVVLVGIALLAPTAHAQIAGDEFASDTPVPVRLRNFEGTVTVQRASGGETAEAAANLPLDAGDRVWTDTQGRAELVLPDGGVLWLDRLATLDIVSLPRSGAAGDIILRLWTGTLSVRRGRVDERVGLRIDTAEAALRIDLDSHARIDLDEERSVWLSVYAGKAQMTAGGLSEIAEAGQQTYAESGTAPAESVAFNTAQRDEFDEWQATRLADLARTERHVSQRDYLPANVAAHAGDLEGNGSWFYYSDFDSWAWRPAGVAVNWAPYRNGRWVYGYGGWSWVSHAPWGWVTGHYGRWHHLPAYGWTWFPGAVYSSAWVSWGFTGGYVGWSPIGFFGRPLVSINLWFGSSWGWGYGRGYHGGWGYPWRGYYPGGRPGYGGVAVPRGKAVAGRGYTRGATAQPWNMVRAGDLGRRDLDSRVVARDAVRRDGGGANVVQANGPLRPRDPSGLAIGGSGRTVVSRNGGGDTSGAVGTNGARPNRPGGGTATRGGDTPNGIRPSGNVPNGTVPSGGVKARPAIPRGGNGPDSTAGTRPGRPGDRDGQSGRPPRAIVPDRGGRGGSRSVTIRPDGDSPRRAIVSPRPGAGSRSTTIVPDSRNGTRGGAVAPRPTGGSRPGGTTTPRAEPRPRALYGPTGGSASPYRSPTIQPRPTTGSRGAVGRSGYPGVGSRSIPGLSRPPLSGSSRPPAVSRSSPGRPSISRSAPRMAAPRGPSRPSVGRPSVSPSRPSIGRPGGGSSRPGASSRGGASRGSSRGSARPSRPGGRG
jgi:hypothetical protein